MNTPADSIPVVTIDGPSGSGKGTISHMLADTLGWHFLDSGALYRLAGLAARRAGVDIDDVDALVVTVTATTAEFVAFVDADVTNLAVQRDGTSRVQIDHRVHEDRRPVDATAKGGGDALVAQTHAQDGRAGVERAHDVQRDTAIVGRARARRDDDVAGVQRPDAVHGDCVVAADHRLGAQLGQAQPPHDHLDGVFARVLHLTDDRLALRQQAMADQGEALDVEHARVGDAQRLTAVRRRRRAGVTS